MSPRLDRKLKEAIDDTGLDWEIRNGSCHYKLFVGGHFTTVIAHGTRRDADKRTLTAISRVKSIAAKIKVET